MTFEPLESRALLAATVFDHVLVISDTAGGDNDIRIVAGANPGEVSIEGEPSGQSGPFTGIGTISIQTGGGDDHVTIGAGLRGFSGGDMSVIFIGGDGDDMLTLEPADNGGDITIASASIHLDQTAANAFETERVVLELGQGAPDLIHIVQTFGVQGFLLDIRGANEGDALRLSSSPVLGQRVIAGAGHFEIEPLMDLDVLMPFSVAYQGLDVVNVELSQADDVFVVQPSLGQQPPIVSVVGGGGRDALDYTQWTTPIVFEPSDGIASGLESIEQIEQAIVFDASFELDMPGDVPAGWVAAGSPGAFVVIDGMGFGKSMRAAAINTGGNAGGNTTLATTSLNLPAGDIEVSFALRMPSATDSLGATVDGAELVTRFGVTDGAVEAGFRLGSDGVWRFVFNGEMSTIAAPVDEWVQFVGVIDAGSADVSWQTSATETTTVRPLMGGDDAGDAGVVSVRAAAVGDDFVRGYIDDIRVAAIAGRPVAGDDFASTRRATTVSIDVLENDQPSLGALDPFSVRIDTPPEHGTASVNFSTGGINYTPNAGFEGGDALAYVVADQTGQFSDPATVFITVSSLLVSVGGQLVPGDVGRIMMAPAELGGPPSAITFTLTNQDDQPLTVNTIDLPEGFSLAGVNVVAAKSGDPASSSSSSSFAASSLSSSSQAANIAIPGAEAAVESDLMIVLQPGDSAELTVEAGANAIGMTEGAVRISATRSDGAAVEYDYELTVQTVTPIHVVTQLGDAVIDDLDDDVIELGQADLGGEAIRQTFTVANLGNAAVLLRGLALPTQYKIINGLATTLAVDATDEVIIELPAHEAGVFAGLFSYVVERPTDGFTKVVDFAVTAEIVGAVELLPEITVVGGGQEVGINDLTPSLVDGTDFGALTLGADPRMATFTIRNDGDGNLLFVGEEPVRLAGLHAEDFSLAFPPSLSMLEPGASVDVVVTFMPSAAGVRAATLVVTSDDADESDYAFALQGVGQQPEVLEVIGDGAESSKADVSDGFGHTYRVQIKGGGSASIIEEVNGLLSIEVVDSTPKTKVIVKALAGASPMLDSISVLDGDMKQLKAVNIAIAGDIYAAGNLAILVTGDLVGGGVVDLDGDIDGREMKATFGAVTGVWFTSSGPVKQLRVNGTWTRDDRVLLGTNAIEAPTISKLDIRGDFDADITLDGELSRFIAKGNVAGVLNATAIGKAAITGDVVNATWRLTRVAGDDGPAAKKVVVKGTASNLTFITETDVNAVTFGAAVNTRLLVGVDPVVVAGGELPAAFDDFNVAASLKKLTVKGIKGLAFSYANSQAAAASMNVVKLTNVMTDNAGDLFGVAVRDTLGRYRSIGESSGATIVDQSGDFEVRLFGGT